MWKILVRGFRDTFEKGGERVITAVVDGAQHNVTVVGSNPTPEEPTKDEKSEHNKSSQEQNRSHCFHFSLFGLAEAVGLSSILWFAHDWRQHKIIGTHLHSLCIKPKQVEQAKLEQTNFEEPKASCRYKGLLKLVAGTANAQPLTNRTSEPNQKQDFEIPHASDQSASSTASALDPEDALEAAKHKLQVISGQIDNHLGIICIKRGWHTDAFYNFRLAWRMGDMSACYNLALCHEQGFGTKQDEEMAVQYYQQASRMGHAGATYNLGVYYAQGRGGLPIDLDKAQELFETAAAKGQEEAQKALALYSQSSKKKPAVEVPRLDGSGENDCLQPSVLMVPTSSISPL